MSATWERIKPLFQAAIELPAGEREAFVRRESGGDPELEGEVLEMLAGEATDGEFLALPDQVPGRMDRLGPIELMGEVGRGGMGVVFRGYEPSLDRDVAVKVLLRHLSLDATQVRRFEREAQAVARLRHPSIVPIHHVGESDGHHFFTMDYLPGPDLASELLRLRAGRAPDRLPEFGAPDYIGDVADVVATVAEALEYAHGQGVVHRDVKPSNLIFGADGRITVVDFGLARVESLGTITKTDVVQGSPHYMSPEQARVARLGPVDHRTDVYSLGVVLYELLTLRRPFDGDSVQEIFESIASREPVPVRRGNPSVPRDLETICHVAMSKAPDDRYRTAGELAGDLRRFLGHRAIHARPPSPFRRLQRFAARHRRAVVLALVTTGALFAGLWLRGRAIEWSTFPRITVELRDPSGAPVEAPGTVWLRAVDPVRGGVGERVRVGPLPLASERIPPGMWRVEVEAGALGTAELFRHLAADGAEHRLVATPRPEPAGDGMVRFDAGVWASRDEGALCPNLGVEVAYDAYWLDRHEVSNAEYREFLLRTGRAPPASWERIDWRDPGLVLANSRGADVVFGELPACGVGWRDARAYAEWAGKRLPTHAEWEAAARGPEHRLLPWGEPDGGPYRGATRGFERSLYATPEETWRLYLDWAAPVASHPDAATPEGLHHMLGNVCEWTETIHVLERGGAPRIDADWRYVLGAAWDAERRRGNLANTHDISTIDAGGASVATGFRCARSARPPTAGEAPGH